MRIFIVSLGLILVSSRARHRLPILVLTQPIAASAAQRAKLGPFGVNARPVQPINGRPIVNVK